MKYLALTIDVELAISEDELRGINGKNGIKDILLVLKENEIKATFFIDYIASEKWGEAIFKEITDLILSEGHQIELHLHPDFNSGFPYLWQYSYDEQKKLIKKASDWFVKFVGRKPDYFRAGSYSANDDTLIILQELGFKGDSSYQYKQRRTKITGKLFSSANKISSIGNLLEIPVSIYKYWFFKYRYNSINVEWCSFKEFADILAKFTNSTSSHLILMMHSFSFLKRKDRKKLSLDNRNKKKLEQLFGLAKKKNFKFVTIEELHQLYSEDKINNSEFLPENRSILSIVSGLLVRIRNKMILNKKFRFKVRLLLSLFLLILSLLAYLIAFPLFEPGYLEMKDVKIVTNSWNRDNDIKTIENYFIELKGYKRKTNFQYDKNGFIYRLPFRDKRKYILKEGIDTLYIATDFSGEIIRTYSDYLKSKNKADSTKIVNYGKWLIRNAVIKDSLAIWPYKFKFTKYKLDFDWYGAWALGNIFSGLSRYFELTKDSLAIKIMEKGLKTAETGLKDGGILFIDNNNDFWYEEYPSLPPNHVLNGHINALLGIYDFYRISNNKKAKELFERGIRTVKNNLNKYDTGYWSLYDLEYPYVSDYFYHLGVHLPQLDILYQLTNDKIFHDYYVKWKNYLSEPYLTFFKIKILFDAFDRRLKYKSFFTLGK